jgi:hypothetical protein
MRFSRPARLTRWLTLVLACAVTVNAAHAADLVASPPPRVVTAQRAFVIPFELEPPQEPSLAAIEVRLYLSQDQGASWQLVERANPKALRFNFRAPGDGEYWFSLQTFDRQGRSYPGGEPRAGLIVVVDPTAANESAAANPRATQKQAPAEPLPRAQPWPADTKSDVPVERAVDAAGRTRPKHQTPSPAPVHSRVGQRVAEPAANNTSGAGLGDLPPGERPRFVATRRLRLACDVEGTPSGDLERIELWETADAGANWRRAAALGSADLASGQTFQIEMQRDGLYGFRLASLTKSGAGERPPRSGESAQTWVYVDTAPPRVQITRATVQPASPGEVTAPRLIIEWQVEDPALADRGISLSYSATAGGPWTTFAGGLANEHRYVWPLSGRLPRRLYVQIEARDMAGHVGRYELAEPVAVPADSVGVVTFRSE